MPELFLPGRAVQKALSPHPQGVFTRILGLDAQALQWRETLVEHLSSAEEHAPLLFYGGKYL